MKTEKQSTPPITLITNTETGQPYDIPEEGSLGLLALGYVGLMAWREKRNSVRNIQPSVGNQQPEKQHTKISQFPIS